MIQKIHYSPSKREVAQSITERIFNVADATTQEIRVALSGGSTPASLFDYWSEIPDQIIRRRIHFWWVDERMVPQDSPESNYGNAYRQFFTPSQYPLELLHPISYTGESPQERAKEYNASFEGLDIAILGMGSDGHTSSLFPGQKLFEEKEPYIHSVHPTNGIERVALSYKGIQNTPLVLFHILGEEKRERLMQAIELSMQSVEESRGLPAAYSMKVTDNVEIYTDISGVKI